MGEPYVFSHVSSSSREAFPSSRLSGGVLRARCVSPRLLNIYIYIYIYDMYYYYYYYYCCSSSSYYHYTYIYIYIDKDLSLSLYIYIYIYTHLLLYFSQIGCILDWSSEAARVRCHLRRVYQQFCQQKSGSMRKPLAFYNSLCRKNA